MSANTMVDLSVVFAERPQKYGYRGDYYFWEYLEQYFLHHTALTEREHIEDVIKQQFKHLSGVELKTDAMPYVEELAHGGMSSGYLSGDFWLNTAIPLLQERFDKLSYPKR